MAWNDHGDFNRALADYNAAIAVGAKFTPAWEAGGTARLAKEEYTKAIEKRLIFYQADMSYYEGTDGE